MVSIPRIPRANSHTCPSRGRAHALTFARPSEPPESPHIRLESRACIADLARSPTRARGPAILARSPLVKESATHCSVGTIPFTPGMIAFASSCAPATPLPLASAADSAAADVAAPPSAPAAPEPDGPAEPLLTPFADALVAAPFGREGRTRPDMVRGVEGERTESIGEADATTAVDGRRARLQGTARACGTICSTDLQTTQSRRRTGRSHTCAGSFRARSPPGSRPPPLRQYSAHRRAHPPGSSPSDWTHSLFTPRPEHTELRVGVRATLDVSRRTAGSRAAAWFNPIRSGIFRL